LTVRGTCGLCAGVGWSALLFTVGAGHVDIPSPWLAADVAAAVSCAMVNGRAFPELISGGIDSVPTDFGAALTGLARDHSAPGELRVNRQFDAVPDSELGPCRQSWAYH